MIKYLFYTSIPGNFDTEVKRASIDSIVGSCEGVLDWALLDNVENTIIRVNSNERIDGKYIYDKLVDGFRDICDGSVIRRVDIIEE